MENAMKKFQRKARLKAMKLAAEEARRAARAGESAGAGAEPGQVSPQASAVEPPTAEVVAKVAAESAAQVEIARAALAEARCTLSDTDANAMLMRAAALADEVVTATRAALAEVPLPRLREAYEIVKAKPEPSEVDPSTGSGQAAQKRPRRGYDPVVSLIKTGLAAANLVTRILGKTHPHLGKLRRAA
jgi:hypothetical protein